MLTESTGKHFLDSGMKSNRYWQDNQSKTIEDFRKDNKIVEWYIYNNKLQVDITYPLFKFMSKNLIYNREQTQELKKYEKEDQSYVEDIMDYVQNTFGINEEQFNKKFFNTYNMEEVKLSQCIQFFFVEEHNYVVIQIHNGCDIRGGYTKPIVFDTDHYEDFFCSLLDTGTVYDPNSQNTYDFTEQIELDFVIKKDNHYVNVDGDKVIKGNDDYVLDGNDLITPNGQLVR